MKDVTNLFLKTGEPDFSKGIWDLIPMRESDIDVYHILRISLGFKQAFLKWLQQELKGTKYFPEYYSRLRQCLLVDAHCLGLQVVVDNNEDFYCRVEF